MVSELVWGAGGRILAKDNRTNVNALISILKTVTILVMRHNQNCADTGNPTSVPSSNLKVLQEYRINFGLLA
jgi:hypothetical protein